MRQGLEQYFYWQQSKTDSPHNDIAKYSGKWPVQILYTVWCYLQILHGFRLHSPLPPPLAIFPSHYGLFASTLTSDTEEQEYFKEAYFCLTWDLTGHKKTKYKNGLRSED